MTEQLYRSRRLRTRLQRAVLAVNDRGGIVLDRTVFYACGRRPAGRSGRIEFEGGAACPITTTVYDADKTDHRACARRMGPSAPAVGQTVRAVLDWDTRAKLMRMHTCLHLLCALVKFP